MNIVLTGFMGTGKSVVSRRLAQKLKRSLIDIDEAIEKDTGMKISDIFAESGEARFRDIESGVIKDTAQQDNLVISTGGGAVLREENITALQKNGFIVNLSASPDVIYERTKLSKDRPLLNKPDPMKEIKNLLEYRKPFYRKCAISINTDDLTVGEVVDKIIKEFNERQR